MHFLGYNTTKLWFCFPAPDHSTQLNLKLNYFLSFLLINSRKKGSARLSPSLVKSGKPFNKHSVASGTVLPIPKKYGSQRTLPMDNQRKERLPLGHNRGRLGHQLVIVRASSFRSSSVLHIAARLRDLFQILSFIFWITGSSWDKEKVKYIDESIASTSLARKTSYILQCAIHIKKHTWQSENYNV